MWPFRPPTFRFQKVGSSSWRRSRMRYHSPLLPRSPEPQRRHSPYATQAAGNLDPRLDGLHVGHTISHVQYARFGFSRVSCPGPEANPGSVRPWLLPSAAILVWLKLWRIVRRSGGHGGAPKRLDFLGHGMLLGGDPAPLAGTTQVPFLEKSPRFGVGEGPLPHPFSRPGKRLASLPPTSGSVPGLLCQPHPAVPPPAKEREKRKHFLKSKALICLPSLVSTQTRFQGQFWGFFYSPFCYPPGERGTDPERRSDAGSSVELPRHEGSTHKRGPRQHQHELNTGEWNSQSLKRRQMHSVVTLSLTDSPLSFVYTDCCLQAFLHLLSVPLKH